MVQTDCADTCTGLLVPVKHVEPEVVCAQASLETVQSSSIIMPVMQCLRTPFPLSAGIVSCFIKNLVKNEKK